MENNLKKYFLPNNLTLLFHTALLLHLTICLQIITYDMLNNGYNTSKRYKKYYDIFYGFGMKFFAFVKVYKEYPPYIKQ